MNTADPLPSPTPRPATGLSYRPEIDGLRAVAVLAVVLFHAGIGCTGGYVGVDVFFVISGFLITSLIWRDLERGRFTFVQFWERRARRIVPALVVVTLATVVAGCFLLLPGDLKSLGRAAASQAIFAANFHYWQDSGYFVGAADEKPLLHTWSLAVEEQFYLVVPFLLWGMFRSKLLSGRKAVLGVLAAGCLLSLALSILGVSRAPSATFYLLPTRAWELLVGAIVGFLPARSFGLGRQIGREVSAVAGLVLILVPVFVYTRLTPFPGLAALPPCLGAALIIWANTRNGDKIPTLVGRWLAARPIVFVGLISYSFYLWHWPFLAYGKCLAPVLNPSLARLAGVGLGFVCAVLSWRYVETPVRRGKLGASRKGVFVLAGSGLAAVFISGLVCFALKGIPQRLSPAGQQFASAQSDVGYVIQQNAEDIRSGKLIPLGVADSGRDPAVLVWGDSHAMAALPAFDRLLKERHLAGCAAAHSATAPVLKWYKDTAFGLRAESVAFNDAVFSYIRSKRVPVVVLSAHWSYYSRDENAPVEPFGTALLATVRQLVGIGVRPYIMLDVPSHPFDVPAALTRATIMHTNLDAFCARPTPDTEFDGMDPAIIRQIQEAGGVVLDPKPAFLDAGKQHYAIVRNGVSLYRDDHHLTTRGANMLLLPLLREWLKVPSTQTADGKLLPAEVKPNKRASLITPAAAPRLHPLTETVHKTGPM